MKSEVLDTWATFRVGGEQFAVRVEDVQEVLMRQALTPVPLAPSYVSGLLNLRGQIVTAIDLRRRLGMPPSTESGGGFFVIRSQSLLLSLIVDEIGDVVELPADAWRDTPTTVRAARREFVHGICPTAQGTYVGLDVASLAAAEIGRTDKEGT